MPVISLVQTEATYEDMIKKYLGDLTEEEKKAKVNSVIVLGVGEQGGFYSIVKDIGVLESIGLVEQLKYYLIQESIYGDEGE